MKTTTSLISVCAIVASMNLGALAQTDPANASSARQNEALQQANSQEFFRASDLIGKATQDSKGNKVGDIKEITFNQQGEIFAFVDVGNGKYAVVPWQALNTATAKGRGNLTLNATDQQLKAGPAVTKEQWGSLNNPKFVQGCYAYYNVQAPPTAAGASSSPGGTSQSKGSDTSSESSTKH